MLPRSIVAVGPQLDVLRRFQRIAPNAALSVVDQSDGAALRLAERDYDRLFENCIDVIEDLLRESGDIAHDSRLKLLGTQIARTDLLLSEIGPGPDQEFRRLVIVEDKLSTNRECRRDVLAQILDYAHAVQSTLELDDLPDAVADWAEGYREEIRRGMRSGNFLLIICGDCIDERLASLVQSYVDRLDPSNLSDVVLIAMPIYSDGETHLLVPHIVGGTQRAARDLTIRVEVHTSNGAPIEVSKVQISDTPDSKAGGHPRVEVDPDTFMREWKEKCGQRAADAWREFVENVRASHIPGLEVRNFRSGAPYLCLSNSSIGPITILRLAQATRYIKDSLYTPVWESEPTARDARARFRDVLIKIPGADYVGAMKRVRAPVEALAEQHDAVNKALSDLAAELRARADS